MVNVLQCCLQKLSQQSCLTVSDTLPRETPTACHVDTLTYGCPAILTQCRTILTAYLSSKVLCGVGESFYWQVSQLDFLSFPNPAFFPFIPQVWTPRVLPNKNHDGKLYLRVCFPENVTLWLLVPEWSFRAGSFINCHQASNKGFITNCSWRTSGSLTDKIFIYCELVLYTSVGNSLAGIYQVLDKYVEYYKELYECCPAQWTFSKKKKWRALRWLTCNLKTTYESLRDCLVAYKHFLTTCMKKEKPENQTHYLQLLLACRSASSFPI